MKSFFFLAMCVFLPLQGVEPEVMEETVCGVSFQMIRIKPGSFRMGSPEGEAGRQAERENPGLVTISKPYYLGAHEVTQALYSAVMRAKIPKNLAVPNEAGMYWIDPSDPFADANPFPARVRNPQNPVEQVGWRQAREFIARLNLLTGKNFRLPTEAEWEYAARAGTSSAYWFGDDPAELGKYAVYGSNAPLPVGSRKPNPWGFFDMYGNVWEFCMDEYDRSNPAHRFTPGADHKDYRHLGPDGGAYFQVIRGGAYSFGKSWCRSAARSGFDGWHKAPDIGFRLALDAEETVP